MFHRLTTPAYYMSGGWPPAGYDYINLTPGDPNQAAADGAKSGGHPSDGTYFVAFGEDATSSHANRSNKALAQNCDQLDDWMNASVAAPADVTGTAAGGETYIDITGDVFVGKFSTPNTQDERNQLAILLDSSTGALLQTAAGVPIRVSIIGTSGGASRVGLEITGFYTNARITFSAALVTGMTYRLVYLKRSKLSTISGPDIDGLVRNLLRSGDIVTFSGGSAWADAVTNPASTVDFRLQKIIADLTSTSGSTGAGKIYKGVGPAWADSTIPGAGELNGWLNAVVSALASTTTSASGAGRVGAEALAVTYTDAPFALTAGSIKAQLAELLSHINEGARLTTISGSYTIDSSGYRDKILFVDTTAARTVTLKDPGGSTWPDRDHGRILYLIDKSGTSETNPITLHPSSPSVKINGTSADLVLSANLGKWTLISEGNNWYVS